MKLSRMTVEQIIPAGFRQMDASSGLAEIFDGIEGTASIHGYDVSIAAAMYIFLSKSRSDD